MTTPMQPMLREAQSLQEGHPSLVRRMPWDPTAHDREPLLTREWLVANGLGGYASGTISGAPTRRYHGYLVSALPAPHGRTMLLGHISEAFRDRSGHLTELQAEERVGGELLLGTAKHLSEFRLELGLPVWRFHIGEHVVERHVVMSWLQNTVYVIWRMVSGPGPLRLYLRPAVDFRSHDAPVSTPLCTPFALKHVAGRYELTGQCDLPPLRMRLAGDKPTFTVEERTLREVLYRVEESRGYEATGTMWSPGRFRADLSLDAPVALIASTEPWDIVDALTPGDALERERERRQHLLAQAYPAARTGLAAELVLAADQFIIDPSVARSADAARAHAAGHEPRSVIAGYPWFTDWGRDTMISLEGLALCTGRGVEAGCILRTFADYVRDGLIPNYFPDGENEGVYYTADASLWFFHAVSRYLQHTGDRDILLHLVPKLLEIARAHLAGTRFGIGVDERDGLLRQGSPKHPLTWMDAKVGDWIVTPRRGKAVEINALWYNALCLLAGWLREQGSVDVADELLGHADRCRAAFHARFWYAAGGYLYDLVDGEDGQDDAALRPNQLFAFVLDHPVLEQARWAAVLEVVHEHLWTPCGLRSLAAGHTDYKRQYFGDLRSRDAAYHQGTVWGWLIGPFIDAWLRAHPDRRSEARQFLAGFEAHLGEACIGSISEVFDAEAPYTARGCIAQAWSVAEVLRALLKTAPGGVP